MFGILVGLPAAHERPISSTADVARNARRPTILIRMLGLIAWMPVIALTLKKAV